jgi:RNA polymerase sigma-70 factor (ECF subfamily)
MKQYRDRYNNQDDATLVASVLAGEREAFDILLARYSSSVLGLCTALLGNTFEAQDIAQEASLQAFLGLARLQEPACFAAWFHAIAANLARSALRRRREHSLYTLSDDARLQVFWIDAPPTLEEYQILREIHETILLALGDLSEVNRQAVIGFYLQGYSYEELAQLLGVPISTVKGRLFQGRKLLKALLRPLADTLLHPISKQRKEQNMTTDDLVELQIDSLRSCSILRGHCLPGKARIPGTPCSGSVASSFVISLSTRLWQTNASWISSLDTSRRKPLQPMAIKRPFCKSYQENLAV